MTREYEVFYKDLTTGEKVHCFRTAEELKAMNWDNNIMILNIR